MNGSIYRIAFGALTWLAVLGGCGEEQRELPPSATSLIAARKAMAAGDKEAALVALGDSIDSQPNVWAYFERARLLVEKGDDAAAKADCQAALELEPDSRDVLWLIQELEKPATGRFKGRLKDPPSASK